MGSKPSSQQNQTSSYTPPPEVMANYTAVTNQAKGVAATPYSAYGGELVSPINSQQNTGIGAVNSASGIQNGYNAVAGGLTGASASSINPTTLDQSAIQQYESPYQSDVINATEAEIQNQNQQQSAGLQGNSISSGAFGGDRAGIAQAALAGQQDIANNATLANLNNQNYSQALSTAQQQQGLGLSASQNTAARQLAAGQQLGALGNTAQTEALNEANAQTNAGTLQQTTQQAQDTAAYNQFLQQQAYPFETTGWLANIVEGIGSQSGGTTTGQSTTQTSAGSQIAGGLLGLASFLNRGGRVSDEVPHRAMGGPTGGLREPQELAVFNPTATGGPQGLGGGSIVPQVSLPIGHTIPSGGSQSPSVAMNASQQGQSIAGTAKAVQTLGNGLQGALYTPSYGGGNQLTGDAFGGSGSSPLEGLSAADYGAGFAKGGLVRQHFDTGGGTGLIPSIPDQPGTPEDPLATELNQNVAYNNQVSMLEAPQSSTSGVAPSAPVASAAPVAPQGGYIASDAEGNPVPVQSNGNAVGYSGASSDVPQTAATPQSSTPAPGFGKILMAESGGHQFKPDGTPVTSKAGAVGIAQVLPSTGPEAAQLAGLPWDPQKLSNDPQYNAALGKVYYQKQLATFGSPDRAAAAYNAGPGALDHAIGMAAKNGGSYLSYLPKETQDYVQKVAGGVSDSPTGPVATPTATTDSGGFLGLGNVGKGIANVLGPAGANGPTDVQQVSTPQYPENSPTPSSGRTGLLGLNISPETRQLMLASGLGIMGGTSMSALTNIGQGGLKGIQSVANMRNVAAETALKNAQASGAMTDAQIKQVNLKWMLDNLPGNGEASSSGPSSITTPTVTAKGVTASPGQSPSSELAVSPEMTQTASQLDSTIGQAYRTASIGAYSPIKQVAEASRMKLQQLQTQVPEGYAWDAGGHVVPNPAFISQKAVSAGAQTAAQETAKAGFDLKEVQPVPGGPTQFVPKSQLLGLAKDNPDAQPIGIGAGSPPDGPVNAAVQGNPNIAKQPGFYEKRQGAIADNEGKMLDQMQIRQLARQRLQAVQQIMQTFQPGAFAEQKAQFVAGLRAVGIPVPDTATANPAAFQEFNKNAVANIFNDVKSVGGGRVLASEIQGLSKANAAPDLQPDAVAAILSQGLGILDYEDKHTQDYFDWKKQNPNAYDTSSFEIPWMKEHPVSQFVRQENKNSTYAGQNVPAASERVTGQSYMTPKGPAVWRGTGWQLTPSPQ